MCSNKHWLNNLFILVLMLLPMVSYGQSYNQSLVIDGKLYLYTSAWDNTPKPLRTNCGFMMGQVHPLSSRILALKILITSRVWEAS